MFRGVIEAANADGTYDVRYDDGDFEAAVARELIYVQRVSKIAAEDGESAQEGGNDDEQSAASDGDLSTSSSEPSTGSSEPSIARKDEEEEDEASDKEVAAATAVADEGRGGGEGEGGGKGASLSVGDSVEARFDGGPDFHPGKVVASNGDGTYAIDYSDGDKEPAVNRLRIRRTGDIRPEALAEGMRCEARHGGGIHCFGGVIAKVNGDGTYNVAYDDGDKEHGVPAELIYVQAIGPALRVAAEEATLEAEEAPAHPTTAVATADADEDDKTASGSAGGGEAVSEKHDAEEGGASEESNEDEDDAQGGVADEAGVVSDSDEEGEEEAQVGVEDEADVASDSDEDDEEEEVEDEHGDSSADGDSSDSDESGEDSVAEDELEFADENEEDLALIEKLKADEDARREEQVRATPPIYPSGSQDLRQRQCDPLGSRVQYCANTSTSPHPPDPSGAVQGRHCSAMHSAEA